MTDPFLLRRFVDGQDAGATWSAALAELQVGSKRGHWMWFVSSQVAGLGRSAAAQHYAISGAREAAAYVAHPVPGPRLRAATLALLAQTGSDAAAVLGAVDAQKLRSSMTLFRYVSGQDSCFADMLVRYVKGSRDPATLARL